MSGSKLESRDIPQARSLDTVRAVVRCASSTTVKPEVVARKVELSLRHADYHLAAAATLGLLKEADGGYDVTELGKRLLDTEVASPEEARLFAEAVLSSPILVSLAPNLLDQDRAPTVQQLIKSIQHASGLAFSTAEARAQTLAAWRKRILRDLIPGAQLSLPIAPLLQKTPTLKSVLMHDWKSFEHAIIYIDTLTILIGANASGKSNALDAIELLRRIALGEDLRAALAGGPGQEPVRGGIEWATRCDAPCFTLGAVVISADQQFEFHYSITIETQPDVNLVAESLERRAARTPDKPGIYLFRTEPLATESPGRLVARLYNRTYGVKRDAIRASSMLRQLVGVKLRTEIAGGIDAVRAALSAVLSLDPIPSRMRQYAPLADTLDQYGANVAGVLAALAPDAQARTQGQLSAFAAKLPEPTVESIYAETVGKFKTDAMLYARERWRPGKKLVEIDARGMSDGTLRFVAILTALLTRPPGSVLVVEEIDNGFHPSRARLLLETLIELGEKRRVDIVVTTHNQALLDAVGPELVPFVFVAHRHTSSGASTLTILEDFDDLPRLLANHPLGRAVATGALAEMIEADGDDH